LLSWLRARFGVFPEHGFTGDSIYPVNFFNGNGSISSLACPYGDTEDYHQLNGNAGIHYQRNGNAGGSEQEVPCPLGQPYRRESPAKQPVLCLGASAMETILASNILRKEVCVKKN